MRGGSPPLGWLALGCFRCVLGGWLCHLLGLLLGGKLLPDFGGDGVCVHLVGSSGFLEDDGRVAARGCRRMLASTTNRESVPSSARRTKAVKVFLTPPSSRFCRIPCCRASISTRFSSIRNKSRSVTDSKSRFIRRTGTAEPMALRTRRPTVLAIACSLRCFSCSAFHLASSRLVDCCG